jgi:hypothetical protein
MESVICAASRAFAKGVHDFAPSRQIKDKNQK